MTNDLRERVRPVEWPKSGWYWHLHHDRLIEWTDDIDKRWDYVVREKCEEELEIRLRLMRPVIGPLPAKLDAARAKWNAARAKWNAAFAKLDAARAKWNAACDKLDAARAKWNADPAIIALHAVECPGCPWDGETIFPEAKHD
jgi:hypothetical protein